MTRANTAADDSTEVEISILYTHGPHSKDAEFDAESERYELARDVRGFGTDAFDEFEHDPQEVVDEAYDELFTFTYDIKADETVGDVLDDVYGRLQGPRVDGHIGYDGTDTRSLSTGDLIVVDGTHYMADRFGFENLAAKYGVEIDDERDADELRELARKAARDGDEELATELIDLAFEKAADE